MVKRMETAQLETCQHGYIRATCTQCKANREAYETLIKDGLPLPWA